MSTRIGLVTLIALLALTPMGCRKDNQEQTDANATTVGQLKEKAGQALQDASQLLAQQKDRLLATSQEQLSKLEKQVNEWLGEAATQDEQVKQRLTSLGQQFRSALDEARQALEKAKASGLNTWQETKPAVETAVRKVQQAHSQITAFLKDLARKETQESMSQPGAPATIE